MSVFRQAAYFLDAMSMYIMKDELITGRAHDRLLYECFSDDGGVITESETTVAA